LFFSSIFVYVHLETHINIQVIRQSHTHFCTTRMSFDNATILPDQSDEDVPPPLVLEDIDCLDTNEEGVFLEDDELANAQEKIKTWMTLKDEITKLSGALSDRRKRKKVLDSSIQTFMHSNKIPHFDMSHGTLRLATSNRKQPMNLKWITEKLHLIEGLTDEHKTQIVAALQDRPITHVSQLKHHSSA
jgi:hypothetical protein